MKSVHLLIWEMLWKEIQKLLYPKINSELYKQLEKYSDDSRLTKTAIVELALENFLKDKSK